MKIFFDMDGTIANLYAVENWLDFLKAEEITPYKEAKQMVNMSQLNIIIVMMKMLRLNIVTCSRKNMLRKLET